MKTTLTITSKGQTTLPVALRRLLGVPEAGGTLTIDYDEHNKRAVIARPLSVEELSAQLTSYIKPGTKPVLDANAYYQTHRKGRA